MFVQFIGRGKWYYKMHYPNDYENGLDCVIGKIENPEGDTSFVTCALFVIR